MPIPIHPDGHAYNAWEHPALPGDTDRRALSHELTYIALRLAQLPCRFCPDGHPTVGMWECPCGRPTPAIVCKCGAVVRLPRDFFLESPSPMKAARDLRTIWRTLARRWRGFRPDEEDGPQPTA